MTALSTRPKVVLLGILTRMPVGGVLWQVAHYLTGLRRLGFDVYYVEAHAGTPAMLMRDEHDDSSALAAAFLERFMSRWDMRGKWAFHALHDDGRCYGLSEGELSRLYAEAALIINLHGGTVPRPEHAATGRLVYVGTDPVQVELEVHQQCQETLDYLEPHVAFFTFGLNHGEPDCLLPYSERFPMVPTVQPVVLDEWYEPDLPAGDTFTTVGNWRQFFRDVEFGGHTYTWSKHHEFSTFLDLPGRTAQRLELALASYTDDDREQLERHGWKVREAGGVSSTAEDYRDYLRASRGEFSVAKEQNVRLRTGWFSDRSACYLAAGRPVVVQDTGFGNALPVGDGLFAVTGPDDAAAALDEVASRYRWHSRAAAEVARSYFDSDVVLGAMMRHLGIPLPRRLPRRLSGAGDLPVPPGLVLEPLGRRPMQLPPGTVETVLSAPVPRGPARLANPRVSVVMVTYGQLLFTRMALESLLTCTAPGYEVVVVDNDSRDATPEYLAALAAENPQVRLVCNDVNAGFAAANNQGLARARGDVLVLLNNDTIVTRGWLDGLLAHLADDGIGLVGAVTNRISNEAQIDTSYRDYGGLADFARRRRADHAGKSFDIPVATMFCVAMTRATYETVGPLDEGFGVGTLEDDDYSQRVRQAGLRVVCAEDVFVHHFSQATFSQLYVTGEYGELQMRNRERYERKWGAWTPYERRSSDDYLATRTAVVDAVQAVAPSGATVAVVSKGDDAVVDLPERRGWHVPRTADGAYAGHYPASATAAIRMVDDLAREGATHLVVPQWSSWWLDHYEGLATHLDERYRLASAVDGVCRIWSLTTDGEQA